MSKSAALEKLNKALGMKKGREYKPEDFLFELTKIILESNKKLSEALVSLKDAKEKDIVVNIQELKEMSILLSRLLTLQEEVKIAIQQKKIEKIIVERPFIERVKVDLTRPKGEKEEQRSWFSKFMPAAIKESVDGLIQEIRLSREKEGALAVRLVTADGQNFYNAFLSAISGAVNTSDLAKEVTLASINDSLSGPAAPTVDSYTTISFNLAAGANQSLVAAPGASKQIWVYGIGFTVNVAGTVSFQDEDDTAITGIMQQAATGGMTAGPSGNFAMPLWKVATNKALEVDITVSELDGWLSYAIVSV